MKRADRQGGLSVDGVVHAFDGGPHFHHVLDAGHLDPDHLEDLLARRQPKVKCQCRRIHQDSGT